MTKSSNCLYVVVFRRNASNVDEETVILQALTEAYPQENTAWADPPSKDLNGPSVRQYNLLTSISSGSVVLRRAAVTRLEAKLGADNVIVQHSDTNPRSIKLAVFDMDSTLIQQEVIDLLAAHAGVEAQVADITSRAMNGELDFSGSLKERVGLLQGLPDTVFNDLKGKLTLTPGADVLLKVLKTQGVKTALLSGGFMPLATFIGEKLGIDHVHANELEVQSHKLTGKLAESCVIVNGERKCELLEEIARLEGIVRQDQIMAVGDGANDLPMLGKAGLGIAVNAKPRVQELAPFKLNCVSLIDVLHVLGHTRNEIEQMARQTD